MIYRRIAHTWQGFPPSSLSTRSRQRFYFTALIALTALLILFYHRPRFPRSLEVVDLVPDGAQQSRPSGDSPPVYNEGKPKSKDYKYTRSLVVASLLEESTSWVESSLAHDDSLRSFIYVVDDTNAYYKVPANKGHEAMVYLTYIIDHYHDLSDVTIFVHSHQLTWHNNDLLFSDSVEMIKRLRSERINRYGYMNLRCHLDPGCPRHIELSTETDDINIPEAVIMKDAWREIFPGSTTLPAVLSQPCCGQFALSADRIHAISRDAYIFYREWLLGTHLEDHLSGRIWEYLWQYIFGGREELCVEEHVCYCDGYSVCLGSKEAFEEYIKGQKEAKRLNAMLDGEEYDVPEEGGGGTTKLDHELGEEERRQVQGKVDRLIGELEVKRLAALERGLDPSERQNELGDLYSA